jgi:hypothetical protein
MREARGGRMLCTEFYICKYEDASLLYLFSSLISELIVLLYYTYLTILL